MVVVGLFMIFANEPPRQVQAEVEQKVEAPAVNKTIENETIPSAEVQTAKPKPIEQPKPKPVVKPQVSLTKQQIMTAAGIPESEWAAVDYIISKESGWRHTVWNTTGSGAYGLCQSLPASKMSSAGADYLTNPVTQMKWCDSYAKARYGGWWSAKSFWQSNKWW